MKNTKQALVAGALALGALGSAALAQEKIDFEALTRIRKEARAHSQILKYLHFLTDVHGPRLTGSPQYKAAADWTAKELTGLGLQNARLEPWEFGHPGWTNERFVAHLVAPVKDALVGEVVAWTPGTKGAVRAAAVRIEPPTSFRPRRRLPVRPLRLHRQRRPRPSHPLPRPRLRRPRRPPPRRRPLAPRARSARRRRS